MKLTKLLLPLFLTTTIITACTSPKINKETSAEKAVVHFDETTFTENDFIIELTNDPIEKIFHFAAGTYSFTNTIPLAELNNFTIQGAGLSETIFDFSQSTSSSGEGIAAIDCSNLVLCGFTVQNTNGGNGITARNIKGIRFNEVGAVWSTRSKSNGVYGIYPVESDDVIVENCFAQAAIDAGIYSGQNKRVILRNNKMTMNVFGMEVENNIDAEVYGNEYIQNTAGLLVYDLAGVKRIKNGSNCKVYNNIFTNNNESNFAEVGSTFAADVPPGIGLLYAGTTQLEITNNTFKDNETTAILGVAYFVVDPKFNPIKDVRFSYFNKKIYIHENSYSSGGGLYNKVGVSDRQFGPLFEALTDKNGGVRPQILLDNQDYTTEGLPFTGSRPIIEEPSSPTLVETSIASAINGHVSITSTSQHEFRGRGTTFDEFTLDNEPSECY